MKILYISVHLGGGAGKAIAGLAVECKNHAEQTIVLLDKPNDLKYYNQLVEYGIDVILEPNESEMKALIEEHDIVVLNWWGHPKMVEFLQKFPHSECRMVIWNHINGCTYPYLPYNFLEQFQYVFFTSEYSFDNDLWNCYEKAEIRKKSAVIYGMGDFHPENVRCKEDYTIDSGFNVGYVGTLNYAKLYEGFEEYYEELIADIPDIKFTMLGRVDEKVLLDVKERGLEKYFVFPGYVDDPENFYKNFDIFVYLLNSNSYATTENVLLEAMSYALPIVVRNNSLERNVICDSGYLVNDKEMFKKCIMDLYSNISLREKMGKLARQFVIQNYNGRDNAKKFLRKCEEIVCVEKKVFKFNHVLLLISDLVLMRKATWECSEM